jgi:hypothetical protein
MVLHPNAVTQYGTTRERRARVNTKNAHLVERIVTIEGTALQTERDETIGER